MADRLKLAQGLRTLPASARQDLAQREEDIQRGKTVELLRRAGKEMYDNPIVNTAIGFTPVLGDIQATGETMAALNRGAPWQETAGYAAGMLPFVPMIGKTVWHGSPHTFEKFDLSKIGTGEGAQAYGHGLYLAESPDVATEYSKMSGMVQPPPRRMFQGAELTPGTPEYHAGTLLERSTLPAARKEVASWIKDAENWSAARKADPKEAQVLSGWNKTLEMLNKAGKKSDFSVAEGGNLYKVDLPDEQIAKMLDWDKRLSEQGNPALQEWFDSQKTYPGGYAFNEHTGESLYKALVGRGMTPAQASVELQQAGIPGIRYLDQASRGAGDGTRNYVVFSDEIPQILERNNQPLVNALRNKQNVGNVPIEMIEHGESAMPGGKLTWPTAQQTIKEYAEMPTEMPPIQVMAPDEVGGKWMIYDGSHRYEAAKLRGMKDIPVEFDASDIEAARQAGFIK
jgi:hypothetical protein